MKQISTILMFLVILTHSMQAYAAKPVSRYDAATQTCRVLSDGPLEWDSRSWGEGGKTFKATCQGCHNSKDKIAPFLWSESKSQEAWNRVFASRYPKCAQDGSWNAISEEQLRKVNDFLWRWANNSLASSCHG
ncbi:MAG: hypothetical protein KJ990_02305 [Proteobacteria bacterium]|nr:hypothetical protein [Pseudomonadota bacterium]MBU1649297.1 hypothetical protein [Pseudomonadota bacterium]MBU1986426.1 hypothetical protein [Pseudomonadota bacterium]